MEFIESFPYIVKYKKKKGRTQCRRLPALCGVWGRVVFKSQALPTQMQRLGLEPGTFRLQTIGSVNSKIV